MKLGIDPGKTGAIALLTDCDSVLEVIDMPEPYRLGEYLARHAHETAVIEKQGAFARGGRTMGATSAFTTGRGYGILLGMLIAYNYEIVEVTPQLWKRRAGLIGEPKSASLELARKIHPNMRDQLTRKKDHGRAEAMLIAQYGVR